MKIFSFFIAALLAFNSSQAQVFPIDTISMTGPVNQRINYVYVGDGYTADEQDKFIADVINMNNALFNTMPFKEYRNYFNVFAIKVVSTESGVKHANTASDCPGGGEFQPTSNPNNYFGTRFDVGNIHRLVAPQNLGKLNSVLASNFPQYDQVLVVANTIYYGGSGGTAATSTTNVNAPEIMIHEIGHSFASLADEYWAGIQYAAEKKNMTAQSNPSLVKWKNWIGVPNIGVFQYAQGPGWYRPANGTCKMEYLGRDFCAVCREAFVGKIHSIVSPLQSYFPSNATSIDIDIPTDFKVNLLPPIPNTLKRTWKLDGVPVATNIDSFTVNPGVVTAGNSVLQATILDTTSFTRADNHITLHTVNVNWNISVVTGISAPEVFTAALKIFPNPFSEQLTVQYELDKSANVQILLTSIDGKTTVLQPNSRQDAGAHTFTFTLREYNLAQGSYFVVFQIDNSTVAKEIIKLQ